MFTPSKVLMGTALALSSSALFAYEFPEGEFEILVAGGISSLHQDGSVDITTDEHDVLEQGDEDWDSWTAKLGVGYVMPLNEEEDQDEDDFIWFPDITPQINAYYLGGGDTKGDVHRYGDTFNPDNNLTTYEMTFNSARLMFDLGLTVASYEAFSIYALGGLGISWNNADLSVAGVDEVAYGYHIKDSDSTTFAYEFGGGLAYDITDDIGISLEYLYTNFGDVKVTGNSARLGSDDGPEEPGYHAQNSDVTVSAQSILLGLSFAL